MAAGPAAAWGAAMTPLEGAAYFSIGLALIFVAVTLAIWLRGA